MQLVETLPVGDFQCNCSILASDDGKEAIVVDPGGEHLRIMAILRHHGLTARFIIHTHAHLDHIYETREVKELTGATIALHKDDLFLYDGLAAQAALFGWAPRAALPVEHWLEDGERLTLGAAVAGGVRDAVEVLHTPGHTPGSCCFRVELDEGPLVIAGDTLFHRSIGRTDLPGGDAKRISRSIRERLYTLPPETVVITGHGPTTRIGDEARHNPFVRQGAHG